MREYYHEMTLFLSIRRFVLLFAAILIILARTAAEGYKKQCQPKSTSSQMIREWVCSSLYYIQIKENCTSLHTLYDNQVIKYNEYNGGKSQPLLFSHIAQNQMSDGQLEKCCIMANTEYDNVQESQFIDLLKICEIYLVVKNFNFLLNAAKFKSTRQHRVFKRESNINDTTTTRNQGAKNVTKIKHKSPADRLSISDQSLQKDKNQSSNQYTLVNTERATLMLDVNLTDFKKLQRELAIKHSHDPQWAFVCVVFMILLVLFAVWWNKLCDNNRSDLQYVEYLEDWQTSTVRDTMRRKLAFLKIFKRRKKRQKQRIATRIPLINMKSYSDGEEGLEGDDEYIDV